MCIRCLSQPANATMRRIVCIICLAALCAIGANGDNDNNVADIQWSKLRKERLARLSNWSPLDVHAGGFDDSAAASSDGQSTADVNTEEMPMTMLKDMETYASDGDMTGIRMLFVVQDPDDEAGRFYRNAAILCARNGAHVYFAQLSHTSTAFVMGNADAEELLFLQQLGPTENVQQRQAAQFRREGVQMVHLPSDFYIDTASHSSQPQYSHALLRYLNASSSPQFDVIHSSEQNALTYQAMVAQRQGWLLQQQKQNTQAQSHAGEVNTQAQSHTGVKANTQASQQQQNEGLRLVIGLFGDHRYSDMLSYNLPTHHDRLTLYTMEHSVIEYAHSVWSYASQLVNVYAGWGIRLPSIVWSAPTPRLSALLQMSMRKSKCFMEGAWSYATENSYATGNTGAGTRNVHAEQHAFGGVSKHKNNNGDEHHTLYLAFIGNPARSNGFMVLVDALELLLAGSQNCSVTLHVLHSPHFTEFRDYLHGTTVDYVDAVQRRFVKYTSHGPVHRLRVAFIPVVLESLPLYFERYNPLVVVPTLNAAYPPSHAELLCKELKLACLLSLYTDAPINSLVVRPTAKELYLTFRRLVEENIRVPCGKPHADDWIHDDVFTLWSAMVAKTPMSVMVPGLPVRDCTAHILLDFHEEMPLVTAIVTHYNRGKVLLQTLMAIQQQTYPNVEVIVVDDGSDEIHESILPFIAAQPRWQFHRINNSYVGGARNYAARLAAGSMLLFLDDDDVPVPWYIERVLNTSRNTGAHAISTCFALFNGQEWPDFTSLQSMWPFFGDAVATGVFENALGGANLFVSAAAFRHLSGYSELHGVGFEDYEILTRLALLGYRHEVVPEALLFVRRSEASMQATMDRITSHQRPLCRLQSAFAAEDARVDMADALAWSKHLHLQRGIPSVWFLDSTAMFSSTQGQYGLRYGYYKLKSSQLGLCAPSNDEDEKDEVCEDLNNVVYKATFHPDVSGDPTSTSIGSAHIASVYNGGIFNGGVWVGAAGCAVQVSADAMQPAQCGKHIAIPVLSWTSRYEGDVTIIVEYIVGGQRCGDGLCIAVFVDKRRVLRECGSPMDDYSVEPVAKNLYLPFRIGTEVHVTMDVKGDASCDVMPYQIRIRAS